MNVMSAILILEKIIKEENWNSNDFLLGVNENMFLNFVFKWIVFSFFQTWTIKNELEKEIHFF